MSKKTYLSGKGLRVNKYHIANKTILLTLILPHWLHGTLMLTVKLLINQHILPQRNLSHAMCGQCGCRSACTLAQSDLRATISTDNSMRPYFTD